MDIIYTPKEYYYNGIYLIDDAVKLNIDGTLKSANVFNIGTA